MVLQEPDGWIMHLQPILPQQPRNGKSAQLGLDSLEHMCYHGIGEQVVDSMAGLGCLHPLSRHPPTRGRNPMHDKLTERRSQARGSASFWAAGGMKSCPCMTPLVTIALYTQEQRDHRVLRQAADSVLWIGGWNRCPSP